MIPAALILQTPQAALSAKDFTARCGELSKAKDWPGLEALARTQIAADSKDAAAQAALGFALLAQNKTDEGRAACERAISLDRRLVKPYIYLGLSFAQAKDRKSVIETGHRLTASLPFDVARYYEVIPIFAAAGQDESLPCLASDNMPAILTSSQNVPPPYPVEAFRSHIQGSVVVDIRVGEDGVPISVTPLAGPSLLIPAAADMAQHYRFKPQVKDGRPIAFRIPGIFKFRQS